MQLRSRDSLTGALTRADFADRIGASVAASGASGDPVSLLVIDVDHFKSINDAFGHARGDGVLREVADRIRAATKGTGELFRYGGDEFLVLLAGTPKAHASDFARQILEQVTAAPLPGAPPLSVSLSIGVAAFPDDATDADALFHQADLHLFDAKRRGRGRVSAEAGHVAGEAVASRLIERDTQLQHLHEFLAALPDAKRGTFTVHGGRGSGKTRFLEEAKQAAELLDYELLFVRAKASLRGRAFGALATCGPQWEAATNRGVQCLIDALQRNQRTRSGILILVDDATELDDSSIEFLRQLFAASQISIAGLICAQEPHVSSVSSLAGTPRRRGIRLEPFTASGVRNWIRTQLRWEAPAEFLDWFCEQTGGIPALVEAGIERLLAEEVLVTRGAKYSVEPRFAQAPLLAWLASHERRSPLRVPVSLAPLVGRDAEIRSITQLLADRRLVTLVGHGGIGKTRLAMQAATEVGETFLDGATFVALAPVSSPEFLVATIAEALRLTPGTNSDPKLRLLEYLGEKQLLLVLDNFEHLVGGAALVSEILAAAPEVRILATSREALLLRGESLFEVRPVAIPDAESSRVEEFTAVQLFLQYARHHRHDLVLSDEDRPHVARICRALAGVPLAIELAAALLQTLSPAEIAAEVERDLDAVSTAGRDIPERHQSLRGVFEYSWTLLSPAEQRVLSRLSVFHGGFRRDAAERVAGASLALLASLVAKSLVRRSDDARYEIHELLRRYAGEKLGGGDGEVTDAEREHCRYFAEFVFQSGDRSRDRDPAARIETAREIDNLRVAWRCAVENGWPEQIELLTKGLFRFYDSHSWYREGEQLFAWATERVVLAPLRAGLLARRGYFCVQTSEFALAKQLHQQALAMLRAQGAPDEMALSIYSLGLIAFRQGRYDVAVRMYRKSLEIYERTGSQFGVGLCLNDLGVIAWLQGSIPEARTLFRQSLEIRERIGDPSGIAKSLNNLGLVSDALGNKKDARHFFERSLALSRESGDRQGTANSLNNLGVFTRRLGETRGTTDLLLEARQLVLEGLEVYREMGMRGGVMLSLYNLGDLSCLLDENGASERHYRDALRIATDIEAAPLLLGILIGVAALLRKRGDKRRAVELLSLAAIHPATDSEDRNRAETRLAELEPDFSPAVFQLLRDRGRGTDAFAAARDLLDGGPDTSLTGSGSRAAPPAGSQAEVHTRDGQYAERQGQHSRARDCFTLALHQARLSAPEAPLTAALTRWIGRTYLAEAAPAAAEHCFNVSLMIAELTGDDAAAAHALNLHGIALLRRGDLDEAVRMYREARLTAEGAGEAGLVAMIDQNLGIVANIHDDLETALRHYEASMEGFRRLGTEENQAEVLNNLGMLLTDLGRLDEAERHYADALAVCDRTGNSSTRVAVEVNRIGLWIARGDHAPAHEACRTAIPRAERFGTDAVRGELHKHLGVVLRETNDLAAAAEQLARAADIAERSDDLLLAAETAREQAELCRRENNNRGTLHHLSRAHRCFGRLRADRDLADLTRRTAELEALFLATARGWGDSIEAVDPYTRGHSERVAEYASLLARAAGLDDGELFWLELGALLHDVGKVVVPTTILLKPSGLTPEERSVMERHPDAGVELVGEVNLPPEVIHMIRHHHERWDGRGYPARLAGDEISLQARTLCVADVYDALTTSRPYRGAFGHDEALRIMGGMQGHFDPALLRLFCGGALEAQLRQHNPDAALPRLDANPYAARCA